MIGVPGPRLSPEFSPVIESTEFGRSLPRRVASATAAADLLLHPDLIGADRHPDLERRHARVLADRPFARRRLIDVLRDDRQRLSRARAPAPPWRAPSPSRRARRAADPSRSA